MYSQQPLISFFWSLNHFYLYTNTSFHRFFQETYSLIEMEILEALMRIGRRRKKKKSDGNYAECVSIGRGSWELKEIRKTFDFLFFSWDVSMSVGGGGEKLRSWRKYKTKLGYWEKGLCCSHYIPTPHQQYTIKLKVNTVLPIQISDNVLLTHPATWTYSLHGLYCSIMMPPKVSLHTIYTSKFLWLLCPVL